MLFGEYDGLNDVGKTNAPDAEDSTMNASSNTRESETPRKKAKLNNVADHLPEAEWVLKNQKPLTQQMFDSSIVNEMDVDILSSPSKRKAKLSTKENDNRITNKLQQKIMLENMFRFFGITFFPLVDPTDLEFNHEKQTIEITRSMIGIRLDLFNTDKATFEQPYYILLKKAAPSKKISNETPDNTKWCIFKHTIPIYLDIAKIMKIINPNGARTYSDLFIFSKEVYIQLYDILDRRHVVDTLAAQGVITKLHNDISSTSISFSVKNIKVQIFIDDKNITSCLILGGIKDIELKAKWETFLNGPLSDLEFKLSQLS